MGKDQKKDKQNCEGYFHEEFLDGILPRQGGMTSFHLQRSSVARRTKSIAYLYAIDNTETLYSHRRLNEIIYLAVGY